MVSAKAAIAVATEIRIVEQAMGMIFVLRCVSPDTNLYREFLFLDAAERAKAACALEAKRWRCDQRIQYDTVDAALVIAALEHIQ